EGDAIDFVECRLKPPNDIGGANLANGKRLEIDLDPAAIESGIGAVNSNKRGKTVDSGIFENGVCESLLPFAHRAEGNALWSFRDAENYARVLNREKTFGYVHVEKNGADQRRKRNNERNGAKAEHESQRTSVKGD